MYVGYPLYEDDFEYPLVVSTDPTSDIKFVMHDGCGRAKVSVNGFCLCKPRVLVCFEV